MLERLKTIAPSVAFTVSHEINTMAKPKINGYKCYNVTVTAHCVYNGELLEKRYKDYLFLQSIEEIESHLPRLIEGVSIDLFNVIISTSSFDVTKRLTDPIGDNIRSQLQNVIDFVIIALPSYYSHEAHGTTPLTEFINEGGEIPDFNE